MANLKFFKGTVQPTEVGSVWFDKSNNLIKVITENGPETYVGVQKASWYESEDGQTKKLTLVNEAGTEIVLDFSDVASAKILGALRTELDTAKETLENVGTRLTTAEDTITEHGNKLTELEGEIDKNTAKLTDVAEGETVKALIDAAVAVEKERAEGAEGTLTEEIENLKTADEGFETRIATLEGKFGEGEDGVDAMINAAIVKLDTPEAGVTGEGTFVDVTVKQVDGIVTEVVVAENDIASAVALGNEVTRATEAEAAINAKIGVPAGVDGVTEYSATYTVGQDVKAAKDAAAAAQADIDAFFAAAETGEAALDTLKEIQDFLNSDDGTVQTLIDDVAANKLAIEKLNGTEEGSVAKAVADAKSEIVGGTFDESDAKTLVAINDELDTLFAAVGEDGVVDEKIAAALEPVVKNVGDNATAIATLQEKVDTNGKVSEAIAAAKSEVIGDAETYTTLGAVEKALVDLDAATIKSVAGTEAEFIKATTTEGAVTVGATLGTMDYATDAVTNGLATTEVVETYVKDSWSWAEFN